jgi:hypothetical protein
VGVALGKRVTVDAVSLFGVERAWAIASHVIDGLGDGFHVEWINAPSITAKVIGFEPWWDWEPELLKGVAMSPDMMTMANGEHAVTVLISVSQPSPTT